MKHRTPDRSIERSSHRNEVAIEYVKPEVTNAQFAKNDPTFAKACELAEVEPTKRQASKFRNKRGAAYEAWQRHQHKPKGQ